jgi:mono/diheme cytochrome c family protein
MKIRFLSILLLSTCALGCSSEQRDPKQWPISRDELSKSAGSEDQAELTYRRYCIGCHGSDGRGNGGVTGADFTQAGGVLVKPDADLIVSVRDGKQGKSGVMPAHKPMLKEEQIAAVVSYVRARFGEKTEANAN